jgi:hypothetical protein
MGCWNHTCFLSNLPITWGEETAVMTLLRNREGYDSVYSTRFYVPVPGMLYGKYDDYGGLEDVHGPMVDFIVDGVKNLGDFQGTAEHFTREGDQGNLMLTTMSAEDGGTEIDHIAIKQSVLDRFLEEYYIEDFRYRNPDSDEDVRIGYKYLCALIPGYILDLKTHMKKFSDDEAGLLQRFWEPVPVYDWNDPNIIGRFIHMWKEGHYTHYQNYYRQPLISRLQEMAKNNDDDGLRGVLEELCIFYLLHNFISMSRRVWARPVCSSQETDTRAQETMARITLAVAEQQREDDEENDDAWDPVRELYIEQAGFKFPDRA